jgi:hypothetical protein
MRYLSGCEQTSGSVHDFIYSNLEHGLIRIRIPRV